MSTTKSLYVCKASAGTGKTYTLAAHYIALLMNNVESRHILAVTFTNKATEEMKQRILTYLNAIAGVPELDETQGFINQVKKVSKQRFLQTFSDAEYQQKAKELLRANLSDFDNLQITTIDSFLQMLLSGLIQALGQAAGMRVDLNLKHAITTAVDEVLSVDVSGDSQLCWLVSECLQARLSAEKRWDLRPELIALVEELYKENVQLIRDQIPLVSGGNLSFADNIKQWDKQLSAYRGSAEYNEMKSLYDKAKDYEGQGKIASGRYYYSFIARVGKSLQGNCKDEDVFRGLTDKQIDDLSKRVEQTGDKHVDRDVCDNLVRLSALCQEIRVCCLKWKLCSKYLHNLMLAGYVVERIRSDMRENNSTLLAQTAYTLFTALDRHDALFVLQKAGIRYRHIMLDEFQDTSMLQWNNFRRLIEEILAQGDSTLIVGDVKQSIYRWRNGDYRIMNGLAMDSVLRSYYNDQQLVKNFRSRENVVLFNIETFRVLSGTLSDEVKQMYDEGPNRQSDDYFQAGKKGGYVCLQQFEPTQYTASENERTKDELLTYMFTRMEELLARGYRQRDMLILCATKNEGRRVLKTFADIVNDAEHYPHLHKAGRIVSNDSFLLESSMAVNIVICALKMLVRHDDVAATFLKLNISEEALTRVRNLSLTLPLTDMVEQIIRTCLCSDGQYAGTELAYLHCLKDKIHAYIGQYGSDMAAFVQYWDDKMHADAIPATDSDDIRIMTIHSSKGLEAKNVFLPFCKWEVEKSGSRTMLWCGLDGEDAACFKGLSHPRLPVPYSSQMEQTGFADMYKDEKDKQTIDALNLLYVACTRAEDNLFILVYKGRSAKTAGDWLIARYGSGYERGTLQLPEKTRESEHIPKPFSFENGEPIMSRYSSSDTQVQFLPSRLTQQTMQQMTGQEQAGDDIAFGNLCHAILEHVRVKDDVERVVDDFYQCGKIPDNRTKDRIKRLLRPLVNHAVAGEWFSGTWSLLREDTVLLPTTANGKSSIASCRMDRVMIKGDEVIVLDYKFGTMKPEYVTQVREYMCVLKQLGYASVRGYLWLGFKNELTEVTL